MMKMREKKIRQDMALAKWKAQRDDWREQERLKMERERLDLERERLARELGYTPMTARATRDLYHSTCIILPLPNP